VRQVLERKGRKKNKEERSIGNHNLRFLKRREEGRKRKVTTRGSSEKERDDARSVDRWREKISTFVFTKKEGKGGGKIPFKRRSPV